MENYVFRMNGQSGMRDDNETHRRGTIGLVLCSFLDDVKAFSPLCFA